MPHPRIKLYWLNKSRAQRIVWLLQELHLNYDVESFRRGPDMRAPRELLQVHPLGKSPVVRISLPGLEDAATSSNSSGPRDLVLAESGFIAQYLVEHFGQGVTGAPRRLAPRRYRDGCEGQPGGETEAWLRYQYFLHYAEGSLMPPLLVGLILEVLKSPRIPFLIRPITSRVSNQLAAAFVAPELARNLAFLEEQLKTAPGGDGSGKGYLCGPHLTAADILMVFPLQVARQRAGGLTHGKEGKQLAEQFSVVWEYLERLESEPGCKRAEEQTRNWEDHEPEG
ncbi:hypothetical protein VTJ83DRAFT_1407 [Remersonia thermophila]|uniref:GST N-terminal domain-containing protein n=1 Tax=Remersonia thermophila TaxID=72144 RepID=A0ABR4DPC5_9PEZI